MSTRSKILAAARELTARDGQIPSLDQVAGAAGVSKGGLMHHFRSRAALVEGLAVDALEEVNRAMEAAAAEGEAVKTWLRLSTPSSQEADVYRAMLTAFSAVAPGADTVLRRAGEATAHWQELIAVELGSPMKALIVRLVGDGLVLNSVAGTPVQDVGALIDLLSRPDWKDNP